MRVLGKLSHLLLIAFVLSSCLQIKDREEPVLPGQSPPPDLSIEEALERIPFTIAQPSVPFEATQKSAKILDTNGRFDAVEITYANIDEGSTLVVMVTNSQADTPPNGKKGLKLANGSQTWEQGDEQVSAIYWRHEGLTYTLVSWLNNNGNQAPLYNHEKLIEIANSIK